MCYFYNFYYRFLLSKSLAKLVVSIMIRSEERYVVDLLELIVVVFINCCDKVLQLFDSNVATELQHFLKDQAHVFTNNLKIIPIIINPANSYYHASSKFQVRNFHFQREIYLVYLTINPLVPMTSISLTQKNASTL